ncbi:MAG: U32 family peptidase [Magnetococcales bacterium]|nr:U32 family peptidase [Magnetococcales bacterium]
MKISLGPVLFDWGRKGLTAFYELMAAQAPVDIIYLGEVVCSKRSGFEADELISVAKKIKQAGKQPVISTYGLVMSEQEQHFLREVIAQAKEEQIWVEANDMAAIGVGEGGELVAGPHINTYNGETMDFLADVGVNRVVFPVELPATAMKTIIDGQKGAGLESELFAYGRLPLTFSARCYTARAFNLHKANCQFKCADFSDGMRVKTQDGKGFLNLNGVQTMSDPLYNLLGSIDLIKQTGIDIIRLSPQSQNMVEVVHIWRDCLDGRMDAEEGITRMAELTGDQSGFCNGYFYDKPGLDFIANPA